MRNQQTIFKLLYHNSLSSYQTQFNRSITTTFVYWPKIKDHSNNFKWEEQSLILNREESHFEFGLTQRKLREKLNKLMDNTLLPPIKKLKENDSYDPHLGKGRVTVDPYIINNIIDKIESICKIDNQDSLNVALDKFYNEIETFYLLTPSYPLFIKVIVNNLIKKNHIDLAERILIQFVQRLQSLEKTPMLDHVNAIDTHTMLLNFIKLYSDLKDLDKLYAIGEVLEVLNIEISGKMDASLAVAFISCGQYELGKAHFLRSLQRRQSYPSLELLNLIMHKALRSQNETNAKEAKVFLVWLEEYIDFIYPPSHIPGKNQTTKTLTLRLKNCSTIEKFEHLLDLADKKLLLKDKDLQWAFLLNLIQVLKLEEQDSAQISLHIHQIFGLLNRITNANQSHHFPEKNETRVEVSSKVIKLAIKLACQAGATLGAIKLATPLLDTNNMSIEHRHRLLRSLLHSIDNHPHLDHPYWCTAVQHFLKTQFAGQNQILLFQMSKKGFIPDGVWRAPSTLKPLLIKTLLDIGCKEQAEKIMLSEEVNILSNNEIDTKDPIDLVLLALKEQLDKAALNANN